MLEKFYLFGIKAIIFLIPFLSLYVAGEKFIGIMPDPFGPMIFPYITGKNFAFRILVEAAAVLWFGLAVLNEKYRLKNSPMLLMVLAFTFIVGLADILGVNPYNSLWSTYERMDGYLTILHLCLYFMIIKSVFKTRTDWMIFFNVIVLVSILVSFHVLLQKFGYIRSVDADFRPRGTIGNAAFLAAYLLLTMLINMILVINVKSLWLKAVYLSAAGLNLLIVYFTATRGAILALIAGIISFSIFYVFGKAETEKDRLLRKISAAVLAGIALLSILFFVFRESDFIKQNPTFSRISTISTADTTTQMRLLTWGMAWEGIKERPILGWGQENFGHVYTKYFNPKLYGLETWIDRVHNVVLDWLANAGFIGLLFYLGIFGMVFYSLWSAFANKTIPKTLAVTIISGLVVYFFQNLFVFDTINTYLIFFALLAYVDNLPNCLPAYSTSRRPTGKPDRQACRTVHRSPVTVYCSLFTVMAALIIFATTAYFVNYKPIKESKQLTKLSISPDKYESLLALLNGFKQALAYETFGDKYVRMSMAGISENILKSGGVSEPGAAKFIEATAIELEKHVSANPENLENLYPFVNLLNGMAQYDAKFIKKAEVYIKKCLRLSPRNQWVYFAMADNYALKKDYENAFISIQKAVELDPEKDESQFKLAMAALIASHGSSTKYDIAEDALENVRKIRAGIDTDLERKSVFLIAELQALAGVSMEIKNYPLALRFYKEIIAVSPENAGYHLDIAKIYLALGDKENAVKEAEKAEKIDPSNYSEAVKNFIKEIK
jgi:O-antigen ligase/tetratricopeptide (TPR) repeat protein